jgi:hypothetical protein
MNKRGSADSKIFYVMWELLAFAMALIIILVAVRGVSNNNTYWKTYYSRDLGLMADIENINQGDFVMNYALKPSKDNLLTKIYFVDNKMFEISLASNAVEVYDYPKEDSKYPTKYPFAKHKNVNVIEDYTSSDFLVLSKKGNELRISDYAVETADVCPSYNTAKDTKFTRFYSIFLDNKVKSYSESIKAILGTVRYGMDPNATNESTIIIGYSGNFSIYYSDDANTMQSQKLSCIIKMKFLETYNYTAEIKKYDGNMDSNPEFSRYITSKESHEYWVIIMLSDNETKISQNDFALLIDKSIIDYYK